MRVIKSNLSGLSHPYFRRSGITNNFTRDLGLLFDNAGADCSLSRPAVNISESAGNYMIELAAPGLTRENFTVKLEENVLVINADVNSGKEESTQNYLRREFNFRKFNRNFSLPETVNGDGITAQYENGVLKVFLPKKEMEDKSGSKTIVIN